MRDERARRGSRRDSHAAIRGAMSWPRSGSDLPCPPACSPGHYAGTLMLVGFGLLGLVASARRRKAYLTVGPLDDVTFPLFPVS